MGAFMTKITLHEPIEKFGTVDGSGVFEACFRDLIALLTVLRDAAR